jgi:glycine dehydrogenase
VSHSILDQDQFLPRHIGPNAAEQSEMLKAVGYDDLESFISDVVPESIRMRSALTFGEARSESAVIAELRELADRNQVLTSLIGCGYYGTHTPPVIVRNVLENPAWYTAYTPYQPEISQGRLETLLTFQTMIEDLTGLPIANASMLDEATAGAEAMAMAHRAWQGSVDAVFIVDADAHPQTLAVIQVRARAIGLNVESLDLEGELPENFGVLIQYPGTSGRVRALAPLIEKIHAGGGLAIVAADPLALVLLQSPGSQGADVAVGSTQRFGVPMGFGGPHAGYLAVRTGLERNMPGRLVGVSVDTHGTPAYRLALQTREQHIRREKATSNICTSQVLLANMAALYAVWHGPDGLRRIALRANRFARVFAQLVNDAGYGLADGDFFDTLTISRTHSDTVNRTGDAKSLVDSALDAGINIRFVDQHRVSLSFDETTTPEVLVRLAAAFGIVDVDLQRIEMLASKAGFELSSTLLRSDEFLTHPVFHEHRNETAMLRYLRSLADRDLALDRSMIPLGSCTMKLNATTEMEPITWNEFANLHPFAPADQTRGSRELISQLSKWLIDVTGYDAISLQPNAGSQGEFAGLLAIRSYHQSRGEGHRDVCLIPSSAHGTNAASSAMAGMKVVVVKCDEAGNVDLIDLKEKINTHYETLAALMITYPSTHGVFEEAIRDICASVHDAGGQVYVDGANLNALGGMAQPGKFGADVSHLNLHKTFCIPHGGGGPGVGPVAARAHLAPFLPNHPLDPECGPATGPGPISAAPFGSAGILPISWAYLRLMGGEGITAASAIAMLSANYIAARLNEHYPVLYTGRAGRVAHECILDVRPITKISGVTVDDIAKRLMDYGFHAPTMSFPVSGTFMVEPTESEDLREINRFVDAMISIREEIRQIEKGEITHAESALHNAPHTVGELAGEWKHSYSREFAAFPTGETTMSFASRGKYWPLVGRIDGVFGDRNLVCACPPMSSYES